MKKSDSTTLTIDRLTQSALAMARDEGLAALSARRLAASVGTSASAMNYHFGSRDVLIERVLAAARRSADCARSAAFTRRGDLWPDWTTWTDRFVAMLQHRLSVDRAILLLVAELEVEAASEGGQRLVAGVTHEVEAEAEFWLDLAAENAIRGAEAQMWADLALGLISLLLSEHDPGAQSAWMSSAARRLDDRLRRRPFRLSPIEDQKISGPAIIKSARNAGQDKILDAALDVIARKGAGSLSQRQVAATAGVSLAAVIYYFRTKNDLISAAFEMLYRRSTETIDQLTRSQSASTPETAVSLGQLGYSADAAALTALMVAAARDDKLAAIATQVRRMRGTGSQMVLKARGVDADRLDAFIWGTLLTGLFRRLHLLEASRREPLIQNRMAAMLQLMFDGAELPLSKGDSLD